MPKSAKILVTDPIHPDAIQRLKEAGFEVHELPEEKRGALAQVVEPYNAIICRTSTTIDKAVLDAGTNLACIALASTGFDRIDAQEAARRNIPILGLPSYNPDIDPERDGNFISTAEHAVLLILAALGDFAHAYGSMKEGRWEKKFLVGNELADKTVGLIGLGRIAGLVAKRLAGFRTRVIAYDPYVSQEKARALGVELVSAEQLYAQADVISIHTPKTEETVGMVNADAFRQMRDGVFIVNTARAAIFDEQALIAAIKSGKVRRVALDVFHDEPTGLNWELVRMPQVIATPHIGGSTHEAWRRISLGAAENVISFFNGEVRNRLNPPHKAIILAAGEGKRLRPATDSLPKALLEIQGKTILDYQIESLMRSGIKEIIIVVGYRKQDIWDHLSHKNYPVRITLVPNEKYAESGPILGGLALVKEHFNEPVIFTHCDVLFGADAVKTLMAHPGESVKLYRRGAWDEEAGKIVVDEEGQVREMGKHIPRERATGEYLQLAKFGSAFNRQLRAALAARESAQEEGYTIDVFNEVVQHTPSVGVAFEGRMIEIDTPEDYAKARLEWNS